MTEISSNQKENERGRKGGGETKTKIDRPSDRQTNREREKDRDAN